MIHAFVASRSQRSAQLDPNQILQRAAKDDTRLNHAPPIVDEVLRVPGQPLDAATRALMEPRFGHDFSRVRVHTDTRAAESAQAVNARAYTVGRDMVFGVGQYAPGTRAGQQLLAHELTHVVQQEDSPVSGDLRVGIPDTLHEREASRLAENITFQDTPIAHTARASQGIARQELFAPGPMSLPRQSPMTMAPTVASPRGLIALSIALCEVGVKEDPTGSNRGTCAASATRGCVDAYTGGRAQPWCAHFVSWAFEQTGFSPFGHIASVNALRSWARGQGWYFERASVERGEFIPMPGDILTKPRYEGVGAQRHLVGGHTGLVIRYNPRRRSLETVEGNVSDAVCIRTRSLRELDGFIRIGS